MLGNCFICLWRVNVIFFTNINHLQYSDSITSGQALICYQCISTRSWDACDSSKRVVQCPFSSVGCNKMFFKHKYDPNDIAYGRGCANTCDKNGGFPDCQSGGSLDCEIHCCYSDLCNGEQPPPPPSQSKRKKKTISFGIYLFIHSFTHGSRKLTHSHTHSHTHSQIHSLLLPL